MSVTLRVAAGLQPPLPSPVFLRGHGAPAAIARARGADRRATVSQGGGAFGGTRPSEPDEHVRALPVNQSEAREEAYWEACRESDEMAG